MDLILHYLAKLLLQLQMAHFVILHLKFRKGIKQERSRNLNTLKYLFQNMSVETKVNEGMIKALR